MNDNSLEVMIANWDYFFLVFWLLFWLPTDHPLAGTFLFITLMKIFKDKYFA